MTIGHEWVVLDTNVWIFGLRKQSDQPACAHVLQRVPQLHVKVPRQVLLELQTNLNGEEMRDFFRPIRRYPERIELHWDRVDLSRIRIYQQLGCKLGDATIAAHLETLAVEALMSENRDFLDEIPGLPFRVLRAEDLLRELGEGT